jgi:SpoVK/Ycf46/Vps4 family AAA+-type ATPase
MLRERLRRMPLAHDASVRRDRSGAGGTGGGDSADGAHGGGSAGGAGDAGGAVGADGADAADALAARLAARTEGCTGADLESLCQRAALAALQRHGWAEHGDGAPHDDATRRVMTVAMADFDRALDESSTQRWRPTPWQAERLLSFFAWPVSS